MTDTLKGGDFKFSIGEMVYLKTVLDEIMVRADLGDEQYPKSAMVLERILQECPGGVQRHYTIGREGQQFRFMEIELTKLNEFYVTTWIDRIIAGKKRMKNHADLHNA